MAQFEINTRCSELGNAFRNIMGAGDIEPGDQPSYQLCKEIYLFHPLGQKMAESPVKKAMAAGRNITVPGSPEERVVKAFNEEWEAIKAEEYIFQTACFARVYGISSLAMATDGIDPKSPVDYTTLANKTIRFSMFDPLNTAGSLVLNQTPNTPDFMKVVQISVSGQNYHPSRAVVIMNERPVYIAYTPSAFGFVGRSVYQRALYPLKSFLQTMITDDLVTIKAGVLVAMIQQAGSIIDNLMSKIWGQKRSLIKEAATGNVLSVGQNDKIESLNFQNLHGPYQLVRNNIIKNIATAADMPALLLENETLTEGFGEGTEDAKIIADYIDGVRTWLAPLYDWFTKIVQYRAWTAEFYETLKKDFKEELDGKSYKEAFYNWVKEFHAAWPPLLKEPPSKLVEVDKIKLEAIITLVDTLIEGLDPENTKVMLKWAADNFNVLKNLFPHPLDLDYDKIKEFIEEQRQLMQEQQMMDAAGSGASKGNGKMGSGDKHQPLKLAPVHLKQMKFREGIGKS